MFFKKLLFTLDIGSFHCLEKCLRLSRTYCLEGSFFPLTALVIKRLVVFGLQVGCFVSNQINATVSPLTLEGPYDLVLPRHIHYIEH